VRARFLLSIKVLKASIRKVLNHCLHNH